MTDFDLTGIYSLWGEGVVFGILLGAIPFLFGVLINYAYGLLKK